MFETELTRDMTDGPLLDDLSLIGSHNFFLDCRPVSLTVEAEVCLFDQGENEGGPHLLAVIDTDAHLG
jgi:hypothetical protein